MQQLWTPEIRKLHSPNLVTVEVHQSCNQSYQLDEEYFVASIIPFSKGTYAGESHYRKLENEVKLKKKARLKIQVLNEFDFQPGGIYLPTGKVAKRFDTQRLNRVLWKIVRGLHFLHHQEVLPSDWPIVRDIFIDDPPDHFRVFMSLVDVPEHGEHPGVFAYRFIQLDKTNGVHYWALLFLNRIIVTVYFHHPDCECSSCADTGSS